MLDLNQHIEKLVDERLNERYGELISRIAEIGSVLQSMKSKQSNTELLTIKQASEKFQVSRTVLSELHTSGILRSEVKGGRALLFTYDNVKEALNNRPLKKLKF